MLTVFANSLMIATRTPGIDYRAEHARGSNEREARERRRWEIDSFLALARSDAYRHMND